MFTDLTVILEDQPGSLAKVSGALGIAMVNIDGICGMTVAGKAYIHVLVQDGGKARRVLEANHIQVSKETEVLVLDVEDRPGIVGNISRRLAAAEVDVQITYLATSTRLVVGVDDLEKAKATLLPKKPA